MGFRDGMSICHKVREVSHIGHKMTNDFEWRIHNLMLLYRFKTILILLPFVGSMAIHVERIYRTATAGV